MDTKKIEEHVLGILEAIGEDPNREGLRETPARVARMLEEVLEGTAYSNHEIAEMFGKTFTEESIKDSNNAVVINDITVFSYCEHHLALMYDMHVNVAYVPHGRVLGLSKIARIADMAARSVALIAKENTIEAVKETLLSEVLPCFMNGGEADEVVEKLDEIMMTKETNI